MWQVPKQADRREGPEERGQEAEATKDPESTLLLQVLSAQSGARRGGLLRGPQAEAGGEAGGRAPASSAGPFMEQSVRTDVEIDTDMDRPGPEDAG